MLTKMMMMEKLLTFGRRQHHTLISREIIRPSSPTPSHLQTYNLSALDQLTHHKYIPLILLYPNNGNCSLTTDDKVWELKKSLSRSLTQFYPFAGQISTPTTPYIDCNDAGVVFLEAKNDSQLDKFQNMSVHDETFVQLFADNMVYFNSQYCKSLVGVQVNRFACGGMGVAFSMSHIVGDGSTLCSFVNHWASMARYGSADHKEVLPLNPHILHFPCTDAIDHPESKDTKQRYVERATKKFVFPNSKLKDLKNNVKASVAAGYKLSIDQEPTHVEVLTSLLFKAAVEAATTKSGCFKPSCLVIPVDLRKKFVPELARTTMGNFVSVIMVPCKDTNEASLNVVVSGIKKHKADLKRLQSEHLAAEHYGLLLSNMVSENYSSYWCSCLCRIPYRKSDFGWGDPARATIGLKWIDRDTFMLLDTPDGDGIDAYVALEKEEMEIFQNNKELLSYCKS
uniref:acylsugar acyltransferase 3-like n=1 Tax=Erigeron canadensis TaxID=72917 RepID=UPI001CB8BA96|nr:acylsugar acyltransferase 3-like [Erigeron canadensis]